MENSLFNLNKRLNALSVFRSLLETPVVSSLQKLLNAIEKSSLETQLFYYGAFSKALYEEGGNLSNFIKQYIISDENFYLKTILSKENINEPISECLNEELIVLQKLANITYPQLKLLINYDENLPRWDNSHIDITKAYSEMIENLPTVGYGIFSKYNAFKVNEGKLIPVENVDCQTLDSLYGYQRERNQVLENTKALALGKPANNVLLYGAAGTGKSSTIKACANEFYSLGLRLIEFDKYQLKDIPAIIDQLYNSPLKFIFYIDDLSFSQNDDSFCFLKGILEGNVTSYSNNIAIYATSNRRHLIKESRDERLGTDIHLSDTLQETMSLSARFGLTITFSKPEKDLYLEIVKKLADEYKLDMKEEELFIKAEAFAIRASGRSPRTAKQFIKLACIGIK